MRRPLGRARGGRLVSDPDADHEGHAAAAPSLEDFEAKDQIDEAAAGAGGTAVAAAQNWLKGVAALTGLVTTVAVVQGPSDTTKIHDDALAGVVIAMVVGFVSLAVATWQLYSAAYGRPGKVLEIETSPVGGLAVRLADARTKAAQSVLQSTRIGMLAAAIGTIALFAAALLTLVPAESTGSTTTTTCVVVDGERVLEVAATSLAVAESADGVTLGPC